MGVEQTGKSIILKHVSGASAEIYFYGATVTSWKVNGREHMFLSKKAVLDGSAPIRGGVPVVFPIFGPPPSSPSEYASLKNHGFARNQTWKLDQILLDRDEGVSVRLAAPPPPESFPYHYELTYVVTLAAHQLSCDIHVVNRDSEAFRFQALLHNYLAVPDVSQILISGINAGVNYKDKVRGGSEHAADGGALTITGEVDRVYAKVPGQEVHVDDGQGGGYKVRFRGFEDCVIWNPAAETGSKIGDMEDGGWNRYVCVEPGFVSEFKSLEPGQKFLGQETITLVESPRL